MYARNVPAGTATLVKLIILSRMRPNEFEFNRDPTGKTKIKPRL